MKIFNTFIVSGAAAVVAGAAVTAATSYFGGEAKKKGAKAAGDARSQGYLDAIDTIGAAKDAAIKEQQPYADQGKQMVDWFNKYNTDPKFKYDMYTQYAKTSDPLYDFYQKKQTKELNRQMAARGGFGGGRAIQALNEQNANLSAGMAGLTDSRVAREISTNLSLLGSGQNAANNISSIQSQAGRDISGMQVALGGSNAQTATDIAGAEADQISGIGGAITGGISGISSLGSRASNALGGGISGGGILDNVFPGGGKNQGAGKASVQPGEWQGPMPYYGPFPGGRDVIKRINTGEMIKKNNSVIPGFGVTKNNQVIDPNIQEYVPYANNGSNFGRSTKNANLVLR